MDNEMALGKLFRAANISTLNLELKLNKLQEFYGALMLAEKKMFDAAHTP